MGKNKKVKTKNNEKTRNNANTKNTENYKCGENTNNINANRIIDTSINLDNNMPVSLQLQTNLKTIEEVLSYSPDLAIRMLKSSYSNLKQQYFISMV